MAFRGTFELTLDAKNRLTVPAKLRAALAEGVVLAKGVERYVGIWRPEDYESRIKATLSGRNPVSPQARELQALLRRERRSTPSSTPPAA